MTEPLTVDDLRVVSVIAAGRKLGLSAIEAVRAKCAAFEAEAMRLAYAWAANDRFADELRAVVVEARGWRGLLAAMVIGAA